MHLLLTFVEVYIIGKRTVVLVKQAPLLGMGVVFKHDNYLHVLNWPTHIPGTRSRPIHQSNQFFKASYCKKNWQIFCVYPRVGAILILG